MLLQQIILIAHVLIAAGIVGLILMQQGKGADMGAAFGSGASGTVFGSRGSGNFLTRTTAILATLFFISSLTLFVLATQTKAPESLVDQIEQKTEQTIEKKADVPAANGEVPIADDSTDATNTDKKQPSKTAPAQSDIPVSE